MNANVIILFFAILITVGCKETDSADKTDSTEQIKFTVRDLNTKEAVVNFVEKYKMHHVDEIKAMLWQPNAEFSDDEFLSLWYTIDDLPFKELENKDNKLVFGGFTLRFKNNKLLKADYDYR